ncbi:probable U3 small nucleolar RNA-associated protein 11 [Strongylocentrotus purpuratus]|uniref:U3 small nucleolar RNA-associated protein 11 n=1 Tax=Strongylocentrotus purpuratus TaxID=7668 RepID=A0A7M7PER8_STRPU|nr:probable U3 small nucleolar RNA-associated protein 11 [Strongylocentrotus purpuratus]
MSSFKKAQKAAQKSHRERSQPSSRARFGLLEKKKDYQLRARDYHKKQDALKLLRQKAQDRNPDEFYYKMISTRMIEGVHTRLKKDEPTTEEQVKMMDTQDLRYVNHKMTVESKKIEKLKSSLHMLEDTEEKPKNKHTFFVDTVREANEFDPAKHLNTHPALLHRTHNRPTLSMLSDPSMLKAIAGGSAEEGTSSGILAVGKEKKKRYHELSQRIEREKQLNIIAQKMEAKKHFKDKTRKRLVKEETQESAPVFKFHMQRKR